MLEKIFNPMKAWFQRHLLLTREERLLVAGIVIIALIGLAVKILRS